MKIKKIKGEKILDSRGKETISVYITTDAGIFSASSPSGTSTGKYERKAFADSVEESIAKLESLEIDKEFNSFSDLIYLESEIAKKFKTIDNLGANALLALELAVLKAIAFQERKELWQVISNTGKGPILVGNCIGGGMHSPGNGISPNFQEFLFLPKIKDVKEAIEINKRCHKLAGKILKDADAGFQEKLNYESAWQTSFPDNRVLFVMQEIKKEIEKFLNIRVGIGIDMASSTFFHKTYNYNNPVKERNPQEQIRYVNSLIEKYQLSYVEDPLDEEDFSGFAKIDKKCLVVGDDLICTQIDRLETAIKEQSINAVIVKPNQNGSLLQVKRFCELARQNNLALVFSHRSGETMDSWLADLAYAFHADFLKAGISGKERDIKLRRIAEIAR